MKTVLFKPCLLAFALAAGAGGALAKDCSADPAVRADAGAPVLAPYPGPGNLVFLDPYADLLRVQAAMAREFNAFNIMNAMWAPAILTPPAEFAMPVQATALQPTRNGYQLQVNVPGFKPEDIHVQLDGQRLRISAQETTRETGKTGNEPGQFVSSRSFVQTLILPAPVKSEGMKQSVRNGVLTITLPSEQAGSGQT